MGQMGSDFSHSKSLRCLFCSVKKTRTQTDGPFGLQFPLARTHLQLKEEKPLTARQPDKQEPFL